MSFGSFYSQKIQIQTTAHIVEAIKKSECEQQQDLSVSYIQQTDGQPELNIPLA